MTIYIVGREPCSFTHNFSAQHVCVVLEIIAIVRDLFSKLGYNCEMISFAKMRYAKCWIPHTIAGLCTPMGGSRKVKSVINQADDRAPGVMQCVCH